jgi:hypothetical protein
VQACLQRRDSGRWETVGVVGRELWPLGVAWTEYQSRGNGSRSRRDMRALVWLAGSSSGPPGPAVRLGLGGVACAPWVWASSWCADSEGNGGFRADDLPAAGGRGGRRGPNGGGQTGVSDRTLVKGL